jgi:methyl-accepting chemotaxis protein
LKTNRFVDIGMRADYLDESLQNIMSSDPEIQSIELFSPKGESLGSFHKKTGFEYDASKPNVQISRAEDQNVTSNGSESTFSAWFDSSHPVCCQCATNGEVRNNRSQYYVRAKVSNTPLLAVKAEARKSFWTLMFIWSLISVVLSKLLSRKLLQRISALTSQVTNFDPANDSALEISSQGHDEISLLAKKFRTLLVRINENNEQLVEAEKSAAMVKVAQQTAHDIRSPLRVSRLVLFVAFAKLIKFPPSNFILSAPASPPS